ncbi:anhydro-N-acetylmuramic acid kinase [Labilibacter sediminis]|nr:anhydro-N-acetylmuramic acid kinase [Labilibacter sediminis]
MREIKYRVVGVMSGTSLDGLDMALCDFKYEENGWIFKIIKCKTIAYDSVWKHNLSTAQELSAYEFVKLHRQYGNFIGDHILDFVENIEGVDFVASHGHTVFHEPEKQVTFQIGCGAHIAAKSKLKVISDFRTLDIAMGGQGAPLVPIGDEVLFKSYGACVNLGGFANISYKDKDYKRVAFDICPVNIVLNELVKSINGHDYDEGGELGRKGKLNASLLKELNDIDFYKEEGPKSLAREWVEKLFIPVLDRYDSLSKEDVLTTCYHHFSFQIAKVINKVGVDTVLFTGGGAFNSYLMELVDANLKAKITIPEAEVIDFKEALIFAFLGVLRVEKQVNSLSAVTGARKDNIGGSIYMA